MPHFPSICRARFFLPFTAILLAGAPAVAEVRYTVTDLGNLGGSETYATALNNKGQVVGYGDAPGINITHAFLWSNGVMQDLGTLAGKISEANDINDAGVVVGLSTSDAVTGADHAFAFYDGAMHDLLGGPNYSTAVGITPTGNVLVTGGRISYTGSGFVPLPGPTGQPIAISPTGTVLARTILNNHGAINVVVGPTVNGLGSLGFTDAAAYAINSAGQIVGEGDSPAGRSPYIYDTATQITTIIPVPAGINYAAAFGVNAAGATVGFLYMGGVHNHAFLYANGVTSDLNSLIDPASDWILEYAADINDAGQIVGYGTSPNRHTHAFLLTPVPEPATFFPLFAITGLLRRPR